MKPYKFLLVEDEALIAMHIEETLNNLGYANVIKAYEASTALEHLSNEKFDMVLMDINLGGGEDAKDGIDVINEIKKYTDIPVVYITGNSDPKTVHKAKYSLPDGFIVKPFKETDIKITLELALHKAENKVSKNERQNTTYEFSFEENLKDLVLRLGTDGEIHYVNSYIKKISDKPPVFYTDKKIDNSGLDPFFVSTLSNILNEVKNANRHLFYCNVKNKDKGERVMKIVVTPENLKDNLFTSFLLRFNDVTEKVNKEQGLPEKQTSSDSRSKKTAFSKLLSNSLTDREKEILLYVKDGMSNKMIGSALKISHKTVSIHRTNLMKKLRARNAAELVKIAIENNLIPPKSKSLKQATHE